MKHAIPLFALLATATAALANSADPQVTTINVVQDSSRVVRISYTLDEPAYVTMDILTNHVSIGGQNIQNVIGDVNKLVPAGDHTIAWYARRSWPDRRFDDPIVSVQLTASAADNPPDIMDIDLETKVVSYYASIDFLPDGALANDKYRTTHLVMKKVHAAGQTFTMGSPSDESSHRSYEDPHLVTLTKDYYLAIYETTRRQFALCGCQERQDVSWSIFGTDDPNQCPVGWITYNNLRGSAPTIDWPSTGSTVGGYLATIRSATGLALDLPTEAQWEFACRAGTTTALYSGKGNPDEFSNSDVAELAWYYYNSDNGTSVHAVGGKPANPWGFYDMYGNVREWCLDWWGEYGSSQVTDPTGPASGSSWRITRGGDFTKFAKVTRSAARGDSRPENGIAEFGFRLCLPLQ